jgi:RNA polymerase sigma-54 factor
MQTIADRVGVHVSTVGRAISGKYIQTPRGIFPLKFFFTGGTASDGGGKESTPSVKNRIEEFFRTEDKSNPLSDEEIVEKLKENGLNIARRTITKYRKALGIPSSRQRKEF